MHIQGLADPTFPIRNKLMNPIFSREYKYVQIVFVENHWVTITNQNPCVLDGTSGDWYLYDSLNDSRYIELLKPALRCIDHEKDKVSIIQCTVPPQNGIDDCGLFALAYCIAICHDLDPSQMKFDQSSMREHFNDFFTESQYQNQIKNFPSIYQPRLQAYKHYLELIN
jgi:Ulp1 family protease